MVGTMFADLFVLWRCDGDCGGGLWSDGGVMLTEIRRERDEIGNGNGAVVVCISIDPGGVRFVEIGRQIDEI